MAQVKLAEANDCLQRAREYSTKNDAHQALQPAQQALKILRDVSGDAEKKDEALSLLVGAHCLKSEYALALRAAEDAIAFYEKANSLRGKAGALVQRARVHADQGRRDDAMKEGILAAEACNKEKYTKGETEAMHIVAQARLAGAKEDISKLLTRCRSWLVSLRESGDQKAEAGALQAIIELNLSSNEANKDDLETSEWITRAFAVHKNLRDGKSQGKLLQLIVDRLCAQGKVDEAIQRAKEVINAAKLSNDDDLQALAMRERAKAHAEKKECHEGMKAASKALILAQDKGMLQAEVDALLVIMRIHVKEEDSQMALESAGEAIDILRKIGDRRLEANHLVEVASLYANAGELQSSLEIADGARQLFEELGDKHAEGCILRDNVVTVQQAMGHIGDALITIESALSLFRQAGVRHSEAEALYTLAKLRLETGSPNEALQAARDVVAIYKDTGCQVMEADARHMGAHLLLEQGEYKEALGSANDALSLFKAHNNLRGEAAVLETISQARSALGDMPEAQETAETARGIWSTVGDAARAAQSAQAVANIRIQKGEYKETLKISKEAAAACRARSDEAGEAQHLLTIANTRLSQAGGQEEFSMSHVMEALLAAKEALALYREVGDANGEAAALVAVAKVYCIKEEPLLAIDNAKEAIAICMAIGDMEGAANSLMLEASVYLSLFDAELDVPDQNGGTRQTFPRVEALCAATEAQRIFQHLGDGKNADWAEEYTSAARELFRKPYGPSERQIRRLPADTSMVVDLDERNPIKGLGFHIKDQSEFDLFASNHTARTEKRISCAEGVVATTQFGHRVIPDAKMADLQKYVNSKIGK